MLQEHLDMSIIEKAIDPRYEGKLFGKFRNLAPSQKGKVGEMFCEQVMRSLGRKVTERKSKDHDIVVDGQKGEIKSSTLNNGTNVFSFLQIRPGQDYDKMILQAFFPEKLRIFELSKEDILGLIELEIIKPQHGGKKSNSGTFMWYPTIEDLEKHATEII